MKTLIQRFIIASHWSLEFNWTRFKRAVSKQARCVGHWAGRHALHYSAFISFMRKITSSNSHSRGNVSCLSQRCSSPCFVASFARSFLAVSHARLQVASLPYPAYVHPKRASRLSSCFEARLFTRKQTSIPAHGRQPLVRISAKPLCIPAIPRTGNIPLKTNTRICFCVGYSKPQISQNYFRTLARLLASRFPHLAQGVLPSSSDNPPHSCRFGG